MVKAMSWLFFIFSFMSTVFILTAIPNGWALNMPNGLVCDFYVFPKGGPSCFSSHLQKVTFTFFILQFINFKVLQRLFLKDVSYQFIVVLYSWLLLTTASFIRVFLYVTGSTTIPYALWTIPIVVLALIANYLMKNPTMFK